MKEIDCFNLKKSLRLGVNGHATHCCQQFTTLQDNDKQMNSSNCTFDEILNCSDSQEIRNSLKNGEKHPACKICWDEERNGLPSKRLRDNRHYKEQNINHDDIEVVFLDISLSNKCNLKCRSCSPTSSKFWTDDYEKVSNSIMKRSPFAEHQKIIDKAFDKNSLFWVEVKKHISTIKWIDFYGGEPFLIQSQWDFLEWVISMDRAKDITLHFNTNGTLWDNKKYNILNKFKKVLIDFSIDGIEDKARYIRHPSNWNIVSSNFEKIISIIKTNSKFNMNICYTVSILSLYGFAETMDYFRKVNFDNFFINILHGPDWYNIKNIPRKIKEKLLKQIKDPIKESLKDFYVNDNFLNILDEECDLQQWDTFLKITKFLDEIRGESFSETFPEFADIIKSEGYDI